LRENENPIAKAVNPLSKNQSIRNFWELRLEFSGKG
jgi:hypothetical protein